MRLLLFARRNAKEVLREPINFFFGLGFPLVLLVMLSFINANIPAEANNTTYAIETLAPGLAFFGAVFMALFAGMLLAKDRTTSFLTRLFTSPMRAVDFILGYTVPLVVMALAQATVTLLVAGLFGLQISGWVIAGIIITALTSLLFVGLGLLCGALLSDKAVGGICGALLTNIAGWLSGVFIPLDLIGGSFKAFCQVLPFYHSVQAVKLVVGGEFNKMLVHLAVVLAYTAVVYIVAIIVFRRKMHNSKA